MCSPNWAVRPGPEWLWGLDPLPPKGGRVPELWLCCSCSRKECCRLPGSLHGPGGIPTPGLGVELILQQVAAYGWGSLPSDGHLLLVAMLRRPLDKTSLTGFRPTLSFQNGHVWAHKWIFFLKFKSLKAADFSQPLLREPPSYNSASTENTNSHSSPPPTRPHPRLGLSPLLFHFL